MSEANRLMQQNEIGAVAIVNPVGNLVGFLRAGRIARKK